MADVKIDEELQDRVVTTPEHVLLAHNKGNAGIRNAKIAVALKNMKTGTSLVYTEKEFLGIFGKNGRASLVAALGKAGVSKPAVHIDNGKVHVFSSGEV